MHMRVAGPAAYQPAPEVVLRAEALAAESGGSVTITEDAPAAVASANVVYTDVWASMGQESEAGERKERLAAFQVDQRLFDQADPEAIFLHCLPAHRGDEVTDSVIEHPRSRVFDQAENRLHSFKSILLHLSGALPHA
jgi:ornithine carbamoyltransferase